MFIRDTGDKTKPLMVLLHGGGVAGWMWKAQEACFSSGWRLLIPDLPGHGKSAGEAFISVEDCASQVISLVQSIKQGNKAVIAGLSLGAQIAVEIAGRDNNPFDAAIIESALVIPMKFTNRLLKPVLRLSYGLIQNKRFARLQSKQLYIPKELFNQYFEDSKRMSLDNFISIMNANMLFNLPEGYKNSACPKLILLGGREKSIIKKSAELLKQNENADMFRAAGVGHGFSIANPDRYNHIVEKWLKMNI